MIIKPFNLVFFMCVALTAAFIVGVYFILRNKSEKTRKIFMVSLCVFNIAVFFIYKGFLSVDGEFLALKSIEKFNWFDELPLQLCNINMFLIPIGIMLDKKSIKGFSFFLAPLGAFMAVVFPEPSFSGYSLFTPRIIGFYFTHFLIVAAGILVLVLGFYKPDIKSVPGILGTFFVLALGAHGVNTVLRLTGLCTFANYFFTYSDGGVSILMLFRKLIPVNFIYELPALVILFAYMMIIIGIFALCSQNAPDIRKSDK